MIIGNLMGPFTSNPINLLFEWSHQPHTETLQDLNILSQILRNRNSSPVPRNVPKVYKNICLTKHFNPVQRKQCSGTA
jgi:hypothetical protein